MTDSAEPHNPFQAPQVAEIEELRLAETAEFHVSPHFLLCRDHLQLPPICIHYGETDDVQSRSRTLRRLTGGGIMKVITAALLAFGTLAVGPMNSARSPGQWVELMFVMAMFVLFGIVIWHVSKSSMQTVHATWYVCGRYRQRLRWHKFIVRTLLLTTALAMGIWCVVETGEWWVVITILFTTPFIALGYDPERKLELVGKKYGANMLRGHSKKFHRAVRMQSPAAWAQSSHNGMEAANQQLTEGFNHG